MISARLKRRSDKTMWRVVGREGSMWSLAPDEFGATIAVSPLEVAELFTVMADAPPADATAPKVAIFGRDDATAAGYEALAAAHVEALSAPRSPLPPSPEDVFAAEAAKPRRSRT